MLVQVLILFFILLFLGSPIFIAMGATAAFWVVGHPNIPSMVLAQKMFGAMDSFALMAIPFFMLAGQVMERTGITKDIVKFANSLVGHVKGGIGHTCTVAGVLMAGISGSANADATALGSILLPALKEDGYERGFSSALVAASANLGPIIPPSVIMIVYGSVTGYSVGDLFLGGVLPGLVIAAGYMIVTYIYARRHNMNNRKFGGWKNIWNSFKTAIWALLMPLIIIGGILSGIFTATEAGVVAVFYGIGYGLVRKKMTWKMLKESLLEAVIAGASPMAIITASAMLGYILARENLSGIIGDFCNAYISGYWPFYLFILAVCFVAGCFIDCAATMLMMVPVMIPVAQGMGLDLQQFALVLIVSLLTGNLTPPVGCTLFVVCSIDGLPFRQICKPVIPFVGCMVLAILLMIQFPFLTTWLPSLMG